MPPFAAVEGYATEKLIIMNNLTSQRGKQGKEELTPVLLQSER